ncbi:hypothetical protein ElyMa_000558800 [Elysia marginata]|uniref:Uncharacterized protein n=1 Tax=Elysia marginata TaxID=1093978 RepID=A0AAV4G1G2_9GAST|nr:hypothetical protein ElyMa_000558800 [Elysia marginata]
MSVARLAEVAHSAHLTPGPSVWTVSQDRVISAFYGLPCHWRKVDPRRTLNARTVSFSSLLHKGEIPRGLCVTSGSTLISDAYRPAAGTLELGVSSRLLGVSLTASIKPPSSPLKAPVGIVSVLSYRTEHSTPTTAGYLRCGTYLGQPGLPTLDHNLKGTAQAVGRSSACRTDHTRRFPMLLISVRRDVTHVYLAVYVSGHVALSDHGHLDEHG